MKKRYKELMNVNPTYKMGFKILGKEQLLNMLPTYKNLLDKFEKYRKHIEKYAQYEKKNGFDIQYNLMFDNIFSIFGRRGSGKTSAIFSLREQLINESENDQDLVLPIIIPEIISEECDVMGWCLAIFEDEIDKIEKKINSNNRLLDDSDFFKNCKFIQNNKLRRSFIDAKMAYFESRTIDYRADSIGASINRKATKMQSNYEFTKKFYNFLRELCITLKKLAKDSRKEPLIYIMFDDVDLTPKIVIELLSTFMKYLAYPNVIVIVTADEQLIEKVIYQNVENEYPVLRKERENSCEYINNFRFEEYKQVEEDRIQSVTNAYMNKILPPSSRYYINIYNTCEEKKEFIQRIVKEDMITVERFLREKVYEYQMSVSNQKADGDEYDTFLYLDEQKEKFIKTYLMFFGNTSRQIANECLLVEELLEYLAKINSYNNESDNEGRLKRFQQVQLFIKNTLKNVKGILGEKEDIDDFLSKTFYLQRENWNYYIDYEYVKEYYKRQMNNAATDEETSLIIKNMTSIFHLFFFLEYILRKTENSQVKIRIHGQRTLIHFLDKYSSREGSLLKLDQTDDGISHFLYEYSEILENPGFLKKFSVNDYNSVRQYLSFYKEMEILDSGEDEKILDEMEKLQKEHPHWFKTLIQSIVLAFSGAYCITKQEAFIYDEIASTNWIGYNKERLLNRIEKVIKEAIKKQIIKAENAIISKNVLENKELIQENIINIKNEINEIQKYNIDIDEGSSNILDFNEELKKVMAVVGFEIFEQFNNLGNEIREKKKESGNYKSIEIDKEIVDNLYKKLEEKYKELQENPNNVAYYANRLESGAKTVINLRDLLFYTINDNESGERIITEIQKHIGEYQEHLSEYYASVIAEKNATPESFDDIKNAKGFYKDINKIYDEIRKICRGNYERCDDKHKEFKNYVCNIVDNVIDEYVLLII